MVCSIPARATPESFMTVRRLAAERGVTIASIVGKLIEDYVEAVDR